jgi:hypothetical protein
MTITIQRQTGDLEWIVKQGFFTRRWHLYWVMGRQRNQSRHDPRPRVWMATFRELSHLDTYISQFEKPLSNLERLQDSTIALFKSGGLTEEEFMSEGMVYSLTQTQCEAIIEDYREETGKHN